MCHRDEVRVKVFTLLSSVMAIRETFISAEIWNPFGW